MRVFRAKQYYGLLESKALVEYYSACTGYTVIVPDSASSRGRAELTDRPGERAQFFRALFTLVQRISLLQIASALGVSISQELEDVNQFLIFFKRSTFSKFIEENRESICRNEFLVASDGVISDTKFSELVHTVFDSRDKYVMYMEEVRTHLVELTVDLSVKNETVLGLYSQIPQLVQGLINRAKAKNTYNVFATNVMIPDLESDFARYCSGLSFSPENNQTSVITLYLGACMNFFFPTWFKKAAASLAESHVLLQGGADSKSAYISDKLRVSSGASQKKIDIYQLFSRVLALDCDLFRMKKNVESNPIPYYSMVDSVISLDMAQVCNNLNLELEETGIAKCSFSLLDTLRSDVVLENRDQSFKAKIANYKEEILDIYKSASLINCNNFKQILMSIAKKFDDLAGVKKDSNIAYINLNKSFTDYNTSTRYLEDESYQKFNNILAILGELIQLNAELKRNGSSLASLWNYFVGSTSSYDSSLFLKCSTVSSFIAISASSSNSGDALTDGIDAKPIELNVADVLLDLHTAYAQKNSKAHSGDIRLGNAKLNVSLNDSVITPKVRIAAFAHIAGACLRRELSIGSIDLDGFEFILTLFEYFNLFRADKDLVFVSPLEGTEELPTYDFSPLESATRRSDEAFSRAIIQDAVMYALDVSFDAKQFFMTVMYCVPGFSGVLRNLFPKLSANLDTLSYVEQKDFFAEYFDYNTLCECIIQGFNSTKTLLDFDLSAMSLNKQASQMVINCIFGIGFAVYHVVEDCISRARLPFEYSLMNDQHLVCHLFVSIMHFLFQLQTALFEALNPMCDVMSTLALLEDEDIQYTKNQESLLWDIFWSKPIDNLSSSVVSKLCGHYTVEQADTLNKLCGMYQTVDKTLFTHLKQVADGCLNIKYNAFQILELEQKLKCDIPGIRLITHPDYLYDIDYNVIYSAAILGALVNFMHNSRLAKAFEIMDTLSTYRDMINSYVRQSTGIASSANIMHKASRTMAYGNSAIKSILVGALATDEFEYRKMGLCNINASARLRFQQLHGQLSEEQDTGFLLTPIGEYYTLYSESENVVYYLHKTGIFVGYVIDNKTEGIPFVYMNFEEADSAGLVEGKI